MIMVISISIGLCLESQDFISTALCNGENGAYSLNVQKI